MNKKVWNKCDVCGRFVPYADFESGKATNILIALDSWCSVEAWEVLCAKHAKDTTSEAQP